MNQAIEEVEGDFCLFINAGDGFYDRSTLREISDFIDNNDGDFYYGKSLTLSTGEYNYGPAKIDKFFCYRTTMCHQAMVIRTSYLKERGYDTNIKISADREWMVYAFVEAKMKFVRMPIIVSKYKGGGISSGSDAVVTVQQESKIIQKRFFSKSERWKYGFMHSVTLPKLRSKISRSPKFRKAYFTLRYKFLSRGK